MLSPFGLQITKANNFRLVGVARVALDLHRHVCKFQSTVGDLTVVHLISSLLHLLQIILHFLRFIRRVLIPKRNRTHYSCDINR